MMKNKYIDFPTKVFRIILKRDFKSYTGMAIKNSTYTFLTTFISKAGSLLFTIILARLLMPELFGLYSLALSTILLFVGFSDLGIQPALIRFISNFLGKNKQEKAKTYFLYLVKLKICLIFVVSVVLLLSSKFIAQNYYHKPLFLALVAGSLYIILISLVSFIETVFQASNKFKYPFFKELFFQLTRLIFVPIAIIISLIYSLSQEKSLFLIIFALVLAYFLTLIFFFFLAKRKISFFKSKGKRITSQEKKSINWFILPLCATTLSGVFFGYIDMVMLGRFVLSEFIGHYRIAFSLIGSAVPLISFSVVLFPIFSRIKGKRLKRALKKSIKVTLFLSLLSIVATLLLAPLAVKLVFGQEYAPAIPLLRLLSLLLICLPLSAIYWSYLVSKGKTKTASWLLISSTIINIVLNYLMITWLITYSQFMAVIGAAIATVVSRYFYLFGLMFFSRK